MYDDELQKFVRVCIKTEQGAFSQERTELFDLLAGRVVLLIDVRLLLLVAGHHGARDEHEAVLGHQKDQQPWPGHGVETRIAVGHLGGGLVQGEGDAFQPFIDARLHGI